MEFSSDHDDVKAEKASLSNIGVRLTTDDDNSSKIQIWFQIPKLPILCRFCCIRIPGSHEKTKHM